MPFRLLLPAVLTTALTPLAASAALPAAAADHPTKPAAVADAPGSGEAFDVARRGRGRGADDAPGHIRRGRGADDAPGHIRRGRGADDAPGDHPGRRRGGRGADDLG